MMIQRYAAPARTCLLRAATSRVPVLVRRRRALPHQSRMLATQPPLPMSLTGTGCPLGIQMIPTIKQPSGFMGEWMLPPVIPSRFLALVMKDRPPAARSHGSGGVWGWHRVDRAAGDGHDHASDAAGACHNHHQPLGKEVVRSASSRRWFVLLPRAVRLH